MAAEQRVDTKTEQTESVQASLKEQFAKFEADSRKDFDEIGWKEFKDRKLAFRSNTMARRSLTKKSKPGCEDQRMLYALRTKHESWNYRIRCGRTVAG